MAKVILGNHTAVFAAPSEQDRIREFYRGVLDCRAKVKTMKASTSALSISRASLWMRATF
jgi:hypothetical protein